MSITLTSDPIITEQDVRELVNISGDMARVLINAASQAFLNHTGRARITSGSVVEFRAGLGGNTLWLSTTPITDTPTLEYYVNGTLSTTFTSSNYQLDTATGRLALYTQDIPTVDGEKRLKAQYTGGWTVGSLPGSVVGGAVELIRYLHAKMEKARAGVVSESFEGHSVQFETSLLPKSVKEAWQPYKVYAC